MDDFLERVPSLSQTNQSRLTDPPSVTNEILSSRTDACYRFGLSRVRLVKGHRETVFVNRVKRGTTLPTVFHVPDPMFAGG